MENKNEHNKNEYKIEDKLHKLRHLALNGENCKIIAKKLTEYIKSTKN